MFKRTNRRLQTDRAGLGLLLCVVLSVVGGLGCQTSPTFTPEGQAELDQFLNASSTTRADLVIRFGQPSQRFENDRILTWLLHPAADGGLESVLRQPEEQIPWHKATHNLVVVFDRSGRVGRFSLLETGRIMLTSDQE